MADKVITEHEVILNSVKFPLDGFIRESLVSRFPAKMIVGEYDYANEQILSNWIISSQRGGMLVEEMDESIHQDRYWWSTCETRFRSNILLPPLATTVTIPTPTISGEAMFVEFNSELYLGDGSTLSKLNGAGTEFTSVKADFTAKISALVVGPSNNLFIFLDDIDTIASDTLMYSSDGEITGIQDLTPVKRKELTSNVSGALRIKFDLSGVDGHAQIYRNGAAVGTERTISNISYSTFSEDISGWSQGDLIQLYVWWVNNGTSAAIRNFRVYGTDYTYWYMTTGEAFTETDIADAKFSILWDAKLWKMSSDGRWWYATTPGAASPTWTVNDASGGLDDYGLTPKSLVVYFDANGNQIPYCATTSGLMAFDTDSAKWLETALALPEHTQTGLGLVVWNDALFVSGGLSVKKYISGSTAVIIDTGLTEDDGMPQLRSGEIVKFIKGYNEFFALIDSTYEGSASRSQVVSWDGRGWRTWWEATADNKTMYSGIVSSVVAHRLWFSTTDGVYYIPLQRTSINPKKVSGYTYASAGIHISPRFDAGTKAFRKLATKLTLFLDDMSANETVAVTYQIDQAQNAITSAWTSLVSSQTADGQVEQTFGTNGVGIQFYDMQFRIALARGGTNTNSPIIKGMTLSFLKLLDTKKSWNFTINTADAARVGATPKELSDALSTILSKRTLMLFTFRDGSDSADAHYVILQPFTGFTPSGRAWEGQQFLTVVEV